MQLADRLQCHPLMDATEAVQVQRDVAVKALSPLDGIVDADTRAFIVGNCPIILGLVSTLALIVVTGCLDDGINLLEFVFVLAAVYNICNNGRSSFGYVQQLHEQPVDYYCSFQREAAAIRLWPFSSQAIPLCLQAFQTSTLTFPHM